MRFATLAIVLPIALTTAFPIAPAIVQIIKPHPPRAAEAVAEAIFDPPPDHSGAISVPIPPRSLFQRIATAVKGRECYHANSHPGHCPHHRRSARSDDARGATIYKEPDLKGENTFIPANDFCTEMTNIFGGFDSNVCSLSVEKGAKCTFYKKPCNTNSFDQDDALDIGCEYEKDEMKQLGDLATEIKSVMCHRI